MMTSRRPRATIAIVLIPRVITSAFVSVANVFGLLTSVKTTMTRMIANARPPTRRPASHARPAHTRPPERVAGAAAGGVALLLVMVHAPRRWVAEGRSNRATVSP